MKAASIPTLCIGIISITIGFFHLLSYYHKGKKDRLHLSFFQVCLAIAGYLFISAGLYNSTSVAEGLLWQRYQFLFISIISVVFFIFIFHLVQRKVNLITWLVTGLVYLPIGLIAVFTEYAVNTQHPAIKTVTLFNLTYYEAQPQEIITLLYLLLFGGMLYLTTLLIESYRQGAKDILGIILAILAFFLLSANDILVGANVYNFIYLLEYGFVVLLISMAQLLHNRFILLYNLTEEKSRNLEVIIDDQTKELKSALRQAKESDQAKTSFLSTMSHEIRTPMNGIFGMTELMLQTELNEEQSDFMATIQNCTKDLLQIINDVLDFSKVSENKIVLETKPFHIANSVAYVINLLQTQAKAKEISLSHHLPHGLPELVIGDDVRFRQILINLINNALKFTAQQGRVSVRATLNESSQKNYLQFAVSDTGIGIAKSQIKKLFEPFVQAHEGIERTYGGTGLGLAISARLVQAMGGKIWVESVPGKGSTFYFNIVLHAIQNRERGNKTASGANRYQLDRPLAKVKPLRILVVDDNEINLKIALRMFANMGYHVDIARDGEQAIAMAHSRDYNLIFMDIHMPLKNGIMAAKTILMNRKNQARPVIIAMTADVLAENQKKYKAAGMSDFIAKPFKIQDFAEILRRWGQSS
ncbi:MAG: response regulator [Leptospiraceae bacterium]|nr:response regulator [Leptospiraceae bacterium]